MKKIVTLVLSMLLTVVMLGSVSAVEGISVEPQNPAYTDYINSGKKSPVMPAPIKLKPASPQRMLRNSAPPSRYDLREKNLVTSVKNQKQAGTCWAFVAIGSLESHLLKAGKGTKDLSELHMEYMTARYSKNGGTFADGKYNPEGFNRSVDDGGNSFVSSAYMFRNQGVVPETQLPYTDNLRPLSLTALQGKKSANVWLKDYEFLPSYSDATKTQLIQAMKSRIMNYGGLDVSMHLNYDTSEYTSLYDKSNGVISNHGVVLVGWDDDYAKEKFKPDTPKANGAWIVKNSYGTNLYDKGYMYVSYEELPTYEAMNVVRKVGDKNDYDKMYSLDPLGVNSGYAGRGPIYGMNKFTGAKPGEQLSAVTFFARDATSYEVYLSPDGKTNNVNQMTKVASGSLDYTGYKTVDISKPENVSTNFSVVVKLLSNGNESFMGTESNDGGAWSTATAKAGESLISSDGVNWGKIEFSGKPANACIKAFTKTKAVVPTTPTGFKVTTNSSNKIGLSWNAVAGINRYAIYRSKSKDGGYTYLGISNTNSYVNTGLKPGDTYYYKVLSSVPISGGKFKNGTLSAPVSATVVKSTSPATWAPPSGVKIAGSDGRKATLRWNKVAGAGRYAIYWSYWRDGPYRYGLWRSNINSASYYGMMPNRNYYFKVIAGKYINGKWVYNALDECNPVYVRSQNY